MATLIGSYFVRTFFAWVYKYKHNYIVYYCTNLHLHHGPNHLRFQLIDGGKSLYPNCYISFSISAILTLALVDLMYGVFVSPFYVENYVKIYWNQSMGYCRFFEFYFTFHDFFVPLVLILLSTYISLKYSGENVILKFFGDLIFFPLWNLEFQLFSGFFKSLCYPKHRRERKGVRKFQFV